MDRIDQSLLSRLAVGQCVEHASRCLDAVFLVSPVSQQFVFCHVGLRGVSR
nr:MAG TPA: hypothetical protein [Caudoviricetes sp.]DAH61479.1 MAG TPA: hypothetical protein [Caudoviricetes sp.]